MSGKSSARTAPADADRIPVGTRVQRYIVLDSVGEGGMGTVYAAYDPDLDRKVALKLLRRDLLGDAERTLLLAEAKTLAKLRHAHVLSVHDLGAMTDGRVFMITDLVDGDDARAWARAAPRSWREIREICVQAGRGLAAVHRADLVHRDLKPSNILIDAGGHACVADFGLAVPSQDRSAPLAGTRAYMAPELSRGLAATPASDQYAFGLAMYELLHGHRHGEPPPRDRPPRRVPRFLRAAIARMTAGDPAARFPDMDAALRAIAADPGRRVAIAALAAAAAAALAITVVAVRARDSTPPCADGAAALAGAWDAAQRASVQAALTATGSRAVGEVLDGLDLYARDWQAGWRDACRATRVRGEQPEDVLALRMACLDGRRAAMAATVTALARAAQLGAREPMRAVGKLPSVEVCHDVSLLRSRVTLPRDHAHQREVEALEREVEVLSAAMRLDQLPAPEISARAAELVERATRLDAPHVTAHALLRRSNGEAGADRIETLQRVITEAQAARDYERILEASETLLVYLCNANSDQAELVAAFARASYEAAGRPPSLEEALVWLEGGFGLCTSRTDVSIRAFSRLYHLNVARELPSRKAKAASAATNVASVYSYLERPEEAMTWSERAEAIAARLHPDANLAIGHYITAWIALQLGDHARAQRALELIARKLDALGEGAGELRCHVPMTTGMLALARADDRHAARAHLEEAAACVEQHGAADSLIALLGLRARAELALAGGDPTRALALATTHLELYRLDPADTRNAIAHALVARALVRLKRLDEAAAELARAEPFLAKDRHRDERWAMVAFARAELMLARGDAAGAARTGAEARELRARRKDAFHLAELDALIARARRP